MEKKERIAAWPESVGVIADGNRRWAAQQGVSTYEGHFAGYTNIKNAARWARESGIVKALSIYAFSEKNWQRSETEVSALLSLLEHALKNDLAELSAEGTRLRFIGNRTRFTPLLTELIRNAEESTRQNTTLNLVIAFSYKGRSEITDAVRSIAEKIKQNRLDPSDINETLISNNLDTAGLPDPQLLIRSGGGKNLSDFLTWQGSDADFVSLDTLWPDVVPARDLEKELDAYAQRPHRNGR